MNGQKAIIALGFSIAIGMSIAWWVNSPSKFPESTGATSAPTNAVRAPKSETPTLPTLPPLTAEYLPGFEQRDPCFSPSLTPDLLSIVFSMAGRAGSGFDLYESTRSSIDAPFGEPVLLKITVSPETEAYPAISPNGLELIYLKSDINPELWIAKRKSRQEPFQENKRWEGAGKENNSIRLGTPQFLDANRVIFSKLEKNGARSLWMSQRSNSKFLPPKLFVKQQGAATLFVSKSGLRAYYPHTDGGLFLVSRAALSQQYGLPLQLVSKEITGPVDGTIWISPQEDVLIYCSPGPQQEIGSSRRLWQIAF
ncbi:hypothetical protein Pan153_32950 [Gimesia panareensis]|uniref:WD40-like Beta Propeller Repeat protein n=1 Tax=Gimesia panareensis TaxID=2527978 RepID=A0A518FQR6_9PLAN|nr:hypothetical protein [Gimesia panareensis]QDV18635.1 hypothetical protein Pan153_32950 [Gimesia panareensis]